MTEEEFAGLPNDAWINAGAKMVLVLFPKGQVAHLYRAPSEPMILFADDELDASDVVPGWCVQVRNLFD